MTSVTLEKLEKIEKDIENIPSETQRRLLEHLPDLLKRQPTNLALLKIAEKAFDFWHNPDDAIYDRL